MGRRQPPISRRSKRRRYGSGSAEKIPVPRLKVTKRPGTTTVDVDHPDPVTGCVLLAEALGSCDLDFALGPQRQLANAVERGGKVSEDDLNFLLAVVQDIKPRDQLEAMLAAQMAVTHAAIMTFARRLGNVENLPKIRDGLLDNAVVRG